MRIMRYFSVVCFVTFVVTTIALALARPDLSLRDDQISALLDGEFAVGAQGAFIVLAAGAGGLGYVEFHCGRVPLAVALVIFAAATLSAGLTSPRSLTHSGAALVAFIAVPVAVGTATFISPARRAALIGIAMATLAFWPLGVGLGERVTVYGEISFLAWEALRSRGRRPSL